MLRRILDYLGRLIDLPGHLKQMRDARADPTFPSGVIVKSSLAMFLCRLGSLNALEQTGAGRLWPKLLGMKLPSADTIGRASATMQAEPIRDMQHDLYGRLKRIKALPPPEHGLMVAVVDAHETHATRDRCCDGCLERTIHTKDADRTEYYHRLVHLNLVGRDRCFQLDAEPIRPGEDEVAAAERLLDRVLQKYPRAFDLVAGDGLYARSDFFDYLRNKGKHALAVLKDENRDLLKDARGLWEPAAPLVQEVGKVHYQVWDHEGYASWPQCAHPVRVVRSIETATVRRQLTRQKARREKKTPEPRAQPEAKTSEWVWVTTLPATAAPSMAVVKMGHSRWSIENESFNELVNRWDGDHVYKHDPQSILIFWLLLSLSLNLFGAFYQRNLKPAIQKLYDTLAIARQILTDLCATLPIQPRAP
jgi:hypothetical protein